MSAEAAGQFHAIRAAESENLLLLLQLRKLSKTQIIQHQLDLFLAWCTGESFSNVGTTGQC